MAVTVDDLAEHLGFQATPDDTEGLQRVLDATYGMLAPYVIEGLTLTPEQTRVGDLAVLTVAGDLWRRKDAPGGQYAFGDAGEFPAVLPRDPINSVWPWLVGAGIVKPAVVA